MANAKKMDGPTLLAGIKAENNYVADKAMRPTSNGAGGAGFSAKVGEKTYNFPDQKSLDAFKKEAGIK
jgi:hypothetical protein